MRSFHEGDELQKNGNPIGKSPHLKKKQHFIQFFKKI